MSRQPAIWKNRRQGLNKESRKIKANEEEKKNGQVRGRRLRDMGGGIQER